MLVASLRDTASENDRHRARQVRSEVYTEVHEGSECATLSQFICHLVCELLSERSRQARAFRVSVFVMIPALYHACGNIRAAAKNGWYDGLNIDQRDRDVRIWLDYMYGSIECPAGECGARGASV